MGKIQDILSGTVFLLLGIFLCINSKKLSYALVQSTRNLNEALNIKKTLDKGYEIFALIFLIILGIMFLLTGIKFIFDFFK